MCGEKQNVKFTFDAGKGSPPHVRGKACEILLYTPCVRITPACAGKSQANSGQTQQAQDHPRMCGEKQRTLAVQDEPQGSPPHVRGKVRYSSPMPFDMRITPACAGKS